MASMPASGGNDGPHAVWHAIIGPLGGVSGDGSNAGLKGCTPEVFAYKDMSMALVSHRCSMGLWTGDCSGQIPTLKWSISFRAKPRRRAECAADRGRSLLKRVARGPVTGLP